MKILNISVADDVLEDIERLRKARNLNRSECTEMLIRRGLGVTDV